MKKLFTNLKGDLFGGLTAGIVALPLALAFGVSSGLGATAGLLGAIFIGFFASLFGGTNTQISGPTAPMTAVSMVVIAGITAANDGDLDKALPIILVVFLIAGLIQVGLGLLGVGKYIRYIPYPVVSGFMTAIGAIILITQILPSVGYNVKEDTEFVNQFRPQAEEVILENILKEEVGENILVLEDFTKTKIEAEKVLATPGAVQKECETLAAKEASGVIGALKVLPRAIKQISILELLLALGTILIIYGFKRITTAIPSTLVALVVMTSIAVFGNLDYVKIEKIKEGFPMPNLGLFSNFDLSGITPYIFTALTLAILGAIDSLLTSVVADNMTKTKHKPNRELIGQGIGNSIASIFGGIPGAGATIRTVVNINSGGKTKLSGMVAGIVLLVILLALGDVASMIPKAVLSGILITVGIGVMDYKGLKAIPAMPKNIKIGPLKLSSEVLIMITVLLLSTFWNLIYAVGIGLVIASLMFMKQIGDLTADSSQVNTLEEEDLWDDEMNFPVELKDEVFIKHVNGPLFFGCTSEFQVLSEQICSSASHVVIRLDKMNYMDQSGLYAMEEVLQELKTKNVEALFVGLKKQPRYMMERIDIIPDFIPETRIFDCFKDCVDWVRSNVKDTV